MGTVEDLIAAKTPPAFHPLSAKGVADLKALVKHNDSVAKERRVGADGPKGAIQHLRTLGWDGTTRKDLNRVCQHVLKRTSWGTP